YFSDNFRRYLLFLASRPYLCGEIQIHLIVLLKNKILSSILLGFALLFSAHSFAAGEGGAYDAKEFAMHHVADSHEWHIVGEISIPLPCILVHDGLHVFMSSKLEGGAHYKGFYYNESEKIVHEDGAYVLDISITKNVATLLIVATLMILAFISV